MTADETYGLACQGTALLWRGNLFLGSGLFSVANAAARALYLEDRIGSIVPGMEADLGPGDRIHLHRRFTRPRRAERARSGG